MPSLNEQVLDNKNNNEMSYSNLSPLSEDIKGLYSPFSGDAFNNYTNVYLDNSFFVFAPEDIRIYLWRVVHRNLLWFRGFVPGLHDRGVLSSRKGARVCKRMAELTMSGGFRVEGYDTGEKFLERFIKDNKIKLKLTKELPMLNAIGNTLAKVDFKEDNSLSINFVSGNKYFANVDSELNVTQFIALIEYFSPDTITDIRTTNKQELGYYLVEQRKLDGTKAYVRYTVYKAQAAMTQPLFEQAQEVPEKQIPKRVRSKIARKIGDSQLGIVYELPFKNHIGAVVILNSQSSSGTTRNGYSDSTLQDCHTFLFQYDVTNTQKEGNKYFAQTGVLYPDIMIPPEIANNANGNVQAAALRRQETLDGRVFKKVPTTGNTTGEANKPVFFQADNQSSIYNEDLKEIESCIATACGLTPTALAGNLTSNGDRTATEVDANDDITRATIETKRDLIREPMTQLFRWVLDHYEISNAGSNDDIDMIFNSSILNNPTKETEDITSQINAGIMSKKTGIARKNRSYSKKEINEELKQIEVERSTMMQSGADGIWNGL